MQRKRHINFKYWKDKIRSSALIYSIQQQLHSIPILLNMKKSTSQDIKDNNIYNINEENNVKSNVLYSIPCVKSCAHSFCRIKVGVFVVLLLIGVITLLPDMLYSSPSVYATTETFGDSTASMTLDTSDIEVTVAPGETGYASKNIQLSINNVKDYALTITAPASLSEQNTTTSQATSWGYAYGQSGELASMSYTNFTGSAQTLESGNTNTTSNKTLALAASFNDTDTAGHYKANITLALTATPKVAITYTLSYNANGTNVTNLPSSQQCTAYDNGTCTITIPNTTPTRTGYEFLGWADTSNATTAQYQPNTTIPMSTDKTIYGVWKQLTTLSNITNMQQMTSQICADSALEESKQLKDTRDNKSYWVTKLKDGNCWMTQNLDYDGGGMEVTDLSIWRSSGTVTGNVAAWHDPGYIGSGHSDRGNYYSHSAATTVCPNPWSLPLRTGSGSFTTLGSVYNIASDTSGFNALQNAPFYFLLGGYIGTGELQKVGSEARYWTSGIASNKTQAYTLWLTGGNKVYFADTSSLHYGYSVRCLIRVS